MKLLFAANHLVDNPYRNWNTALGRILSSSESRIYFGSDETAIAKETLIAKILDSFDLTSLPRVFSEDEIRTVEDSVFFDLNPYSDGLRKGSNKQIGFLGCGKDFGTRLKTYAQNNYSIIISEVLPSEIQGELSDDNLSYFLNSHHFLPPDTNRIQLTKSETGPIVLIHDSQESSSHFLDKRILEILDEQESLSVIDLQALDPSVKVEASEVFSFLSNPQNFHALQQAWPTPIKFISHSNRIDSPIRNLYLGVYSFTNERLFERNEKSIRQLITEIISSSPCQELNVGDAQPLSPQDEIESLLKKIKGEQTSPRPFELLKPKPKSFSLEQFKLGENNILPAWLIHPATEPSLHSYLKKIKSLPHSHRTDFDKFADSSIRLIHLTENEGKYLSNFKELYGEVSEKNLKEFDRLIKEVVYTYGSKDHKFAELHSRLVMKFGSLAYQKITTYNKSPISKASVELLSKFLDEGSMLQKVGISPEAIRIIILCFSGNFNHSLYLCKKQEDQSYRNILLVTLAMLSMIFEDTEFCKAALEEYKPLKSQYAADYIHVAYLIVRLYQGDLINDYYLETLAKIENRKPNPLIWLTELHAIALLIASSPEDSFSVIPQAEAFLLKAGSLSPESIQSFREKSLSLASAKLKGDVFARLDTNA